MGNIYLNQLVSKTCWMSQILRQEELVPKENKFPEGENWQVRIALGSVNEASLNIFLFFQCSPDSSAPFEKVKFSFSSSLYTTLLLFWSKYAMFLRTSYWNTYESFTYFSNYFRQVGRTCDLFDFSFSLSSSFYLSLCLSFSLSYLQPRIGFYLYYYSLSKSSALQFFNKAELLFYYLLF